MPSSQVTGSAFCDGVILIFFLIVGVGSFGGLCWYLGSGVKRYNDVNLARNGYSPDEIAAMRGRFKQQGEGIGFGDYYTGRYRTGMKQPTQGRPQRDRSWEGFE